MRWIADHAELGCLKHLRELTADHNRISTLSPLLDMESLVKVSVRGNRIDKLDLGLASWSRLENLEIAENGLGEITGLESLTGLVSLNLGKPISASWLSSGRLELMGVVDDNDLSSLTCTAPLTTLRTLRISRNDLALLDLAHFPKLRTLYADENRLVGLQRGGGSRSRLEALSLRSQRVRGLRLRKEEIEGLKRLYLSGELWWRGWR